jgi:PKD repeat protein
MLLSIKVEAGRYLAPSVVEGDAVKPGPLSASITVRGESTSGLIAKIDWGDPPNPVGEATFGKFEPLPLEKDVPDGYKADIVTGGHTYAEPGEYKVTITVFRAGGVDVKGSDTGLIAVTEGHEGDASDFDLVGLGLAVGVGPGAFGGPVAAFQDPASADEEAANFAATISWGDGGKSQGTVLAYGNGIFVVVGAHVYSTSGGYTIGVEITTSGESGKLIVKSVASVVRTGLFANGNPIVATEGQPFSGTLASFADANGNMDPRRYFAMVNWGDNTTSMSTVTTAGQGGCTRLP